MSLLREVAASGPRGITLTELSTRLGLDRSTAHRLLRCLVRESLLTLSRESRRYRPGSFARDLGLAASHGIDVWQVAAPIVAGVVRKTGETVFTLVRGGSDTFCVGRAHGSYAVKSFVVDVGTRRPLGVGAASLAMLASLPTSEMDETLALNERRLLEFQGLSVNQVRRLVDITRRQSFALIDAVNMRGLRAVGVAVPRVQGLPAIALSVGAIAARVDGGREQFLAGTLHEAAAALGTTLAQCASVSAQASAALLD